MSHDARELMPCPFCGGEAKQFTIGEEEPSNVGGDVIVCTKCSASGHVEFGRKENLVSRWNTRATLSPDPVLLGEVRQAIEAIYAEDIILQSFRLDVVPRAEESPATWQNRVRKAALLAKFPKLTGEEV